jgi:hypothetical protein
MAARFESNNYDGCHEEGSTEQNIVHSLDRTFFFLLLHSFKYEFTDNRICINCGHASALALLKKQSYVNNIRTEILAYLLLFTVI